MNKFWLALVMGFLLFTGLYINVQAQGKIYSKILVTIKREACFGSCPVYSAQIYADGTVIYRGEDFVKVRCQKLHKISKDNVKKLVKAFEQINYFSLKDKYATDENGMSLTDLPTTTTSFSPNKKRKRIVNYLGAPKELDQLQNLIDELSGISEYIGPL